MSAPDGTAVVQVHRIEDPMRCHYCGGRARVVWTRRAGIGSRTVHRDGVCVECRAKFKQVSTPAGNKVHHVATWYPPERTH